MNYKMRLFLITSIFVFAKCQDTPGTAIKGDDSVDCYECGIKDDCVLPFDINNGKIIKCDKSCVKYDGYAKDGERKVVRSCGYYTVDKCIDGIRYEDKYNGTTCHCQKDKCNSAPVVNNLYSFIFITTPMTVFLLK